MSDYTDYAIETAGILGHKIMLPSTKCLQCGMRAVEIHNIQRRCHK